MTKSRFVAAKVKVVILKIKKMGQVGSPRGSLKRYFVPDLR